MKAVSTLIAATVGAVALTGCVFGGGNNAETQWWKRSQVDPIRICGAPASTRLSALPLVSADPFGGTIIYDWKSFRGL